MLASCSIQSTLNRLSSFIILASTSQSAVLYQLLTFLQTLSRHRKHMNLRCPEDLPTLHSVVEDLCNSPSGALLALILIDAVQSTLSSARWSCTGAWRRWTTSAGLAVLPCRLTVAVVEATPTQQAASIRTHDACLRSCETTSSTRDMLTRVVDNKDATA